MYRKSLSLSDCDIKLDAKSGVFSGYASVFGGVDSYGDTIEKGAFAETLSDHGLPKMFFNHDGFDLPIGKWKSARRIAERIEPIMDDAKRRDSDFPYVPGLHRVFEYPPDAFVPVSDGSDKPINWQRYCAEVMEYCDRRLGRY